MNATAPLSTISSLVGPPLAEFYLSGLSIISHLSSTYLSIDLSSYAPVVVLLGAVAAALRISLRDILAFLEWCFMCGVEVRSDDDLFESIDAFVSQLSGSPSHLLARTRFARRFHWQDGPKTEEEYVSEDRSKVYILNRLTFTRTFGYSWFWYGNQLVILQRSQIRRSHTEVDILHFKSIGWNTSNLKTMIRKARLAHAERNSHKITVYLHSQKREDLQWSSGNLRRKRPLSSLFMNGNLKEEFMDDIRNYLLPQTQKWYTDHGIPYQRGYLFSGPPGTGKTSLCAAVAAFHGLAIYILQMHMLDEHSFSKLLSTLPERCVLLIEDFDENSVAAKRTSISHHGTSDKQKINPISSLSLSTILNAFDGLTATEGRILVLTTNHEENIDPALLRPGRIDKTFNFEHPNSDTIRRHFLSIYGDTPSVTTDQLEVYADRFAQYLSGKSTTQAKIQEVFIRHRGKPGDAVDEVALQSEKSENKVQSRQIG